jgi:hypothetical protein
MSVAAFPISSCVQTIPCFLPSRDVDLVKPRIACLEMVYEAESGISLGLRCRTMCTYLDEESRQIWNRC